MKKISNKRKVAVFVELKMAEFPIQPETMKAINAAADKVCKLLPPCRPHKLSSVSESFRDVRLHSEYSLLNMYRICWGNAVICSVTKAYLSVLDVDYSSLSTGDSHYSNSNLKMGHVQQFVKDIKSGRLVAELKNKIELAEEKEAAEVRLYQKMRKANDREQAEMILDL